MNVLPVGDYHIKKRGTELYWTNTNVGSTGGTPSFLTRGSETSANDQIWAVSLDGGRYKIVSKADNRYINEKGNFGTNLYYKSWNTYNIYSDSNYCAIQIAGSAATQEKGAFFWNFNTNNAIVYSTNVIIDESKDVKFEFIPAKLTGLNSLPKSVISTWASGNMLNVKCDVESDVFVYNQLGALIRQLIIKGSETLPLPSGWYILKVQNKLEQATTKAIIN